MHRIDIGACHRRSRRGRCPNVGRPPVAACTVSEIEALATSTDLSICQIQREIAGKVSRGVVGRSPSAFERDRRPPCDHFLRRDKARSNQRALLRRVRCRRAVERM